MDERHANLFHVFDEVLKTFLSQGESAAGESGTKKACPLLSLK